MATYVTRPFTLLIVALALGSLTAPIVTGKEQPSKPFAQAELFVELNDTDGDLGLHAAIDGGTWTQLEVDDPRDRPLLGIFEHRTSSQPGTDAVGLREPGAIVRRAGSRDVLPTVPGGHLRDRGARAGRRHVRNEVRLSHVLAAPPQSTVNGHPAVPCDEPSLPVVASPVLIDWEPVTSRTRSLARRGPSRSRAISSSLQQGDTKLSMDLLPR